MSCCRCLIKVIKSTFGWRCICTYLHYLQGISLIYFALTKINTHIFSTALKVRIAQRYSSRSLCTKKKKKKPKWIRQKQTLIPAWRVKPDNTLPVSLELPLLFSLKQNRLLVCCHSLYGRSIWHVKAVQGCPLVHSRFLQLRKHLRSDLTEENRLIVINCILTDL